MKTQTKTAPVEARVAVLEKKIKQIEERNQRVELDKEWELSWTRRIVLAVSIFAALYIFFLLTKAADPLFNAGIATLAFILSTPYLKAFEKLWDRYFNK